MNIIRVNEKKTWSWNKLTESQLIKFLRTNFWLEDYAQDIYMNPNSELTNEIEELENEIEELEIEELPVYDITFSGLPEDIILLPESIT